MEYLSVSVAQCCVLESVSTLGVETVRLEQSLGGCWPRDVHAIATCRPTMCRRWMACGAQRRSGGRFR